MDKISLQNPDGSAATQVAIHPVTTEGTHIESAQIVAYCCVS